jgi:GAF domain-containing protein
MSKASSSETDDRKDSPNQKTNESTDDWESNGRKVSSSNGARENKSDISAKSWIKIGNTGKKSSKSPQLQEKVGLSAKKLALAFVVGMLPVLVGGAATYYFGSKALDHQNETLNVDRSQQQLLTDLSFPIGLTSLLTGAIAAWSIDKLVRRVKLRTLSAANAKFTQARIERTQLLTDLIAKIRTSLDRKTILQTTVNVAREALAADRVLIYGLGQEERGRILVESVEEGFPQTLGEVVEDPCFASRYEEKYQDGRIHTIDNIYEAKIGECYFEQLERFAVKANLVVPLINQGRLIGLLIAHQCATPRFWQQAEIDLLVQISTQAGFALDNAILIEDHASLQKQIIGLIEKAEIESQWDKYYQDAIAYLHEFLKWEDILKTSVEESRRFLGCDRCVIYSLARQSQGVVIAESVAPGFKRALNRKMEDSCFTEKYLEKSEKGRVRAINNIYEEELSICYIQQLETLNVKSNLVVPIIHQGKLFGLLIAHQCADFRNWQEPEIKWFARFAIQVGYALDRAKIIEEIRGISPQTKALSRQDSQILADSVKSSGDRVRQIEQLLEDISKLVKNNGTLKNLNSAESLEAKLVKTENSLKNLHGSIYSIEQINNITKELLEKMSCQVINHTIGIGKAKAVSQENIVAIAEQVRLSTQKLLTATTEIDSLTAAVTTNTEEVSQIISSDTQHQLQDVLSSQDLQQKLAEIARVNQKLKTSLEQLTAVAISQNSKQNK